VTEDQGKVIADLYKKEVSISRIAKEIDMSPTSVRTWVRVNRAKYQLPRRRNLAEKQGVNSYSIEVDCKWNLKLSKEYLAKAWGSVA
jgi:transposase-like protein